MTQKQQLDALKGQLELHLQKIDDIEKINPDLARRIEEFTITLQENNYCGVFDVEDDVYHNGLGISQSRFSYLDKSPFNYHRNTYKNLKKRLKRSRVFTDGDYIHRVLLEKDTVDDRFFDESIAYNLALEVKPDLKNVRASKVYKDKVAEYALEGKEPVTSELIAEMKEIEEFIKEEKTLSNIFKDSIKEKCVYCICPHTGLVRKSKVDLMKVYSDFVYIFDVKSSADISEGKFDWSVYNYKYHVQGAYYEDIVRDALQKPVKEHLLILIEKQEPYEIDVKFIDEPSMDIGKKEYMKYLKMLAECYSKKEFPRRPITMDSCGIPASRMNDELIELNNQSVWA